MSGKPGQGSKYDPDLADEILRRMSNGEVLAKICPELGIARSTFTGWQDTIEGFADRYAHAREAQAHAIAEAAYATSQDTTRDPQDRRIAFDGGRWLAGKVAPRHYGEKITQEHTGQDGGPVVFKWKE